MAGLTSDMTWKNWTNYNGTWKRGWCFGLDTDHSKDQNLTLELDLSQWTPSSI